MTVIVAIDNQNGMMFNNRRQSQDSILRKRILSISKNGGALWMNEYSAKQFASENDSPIIVDNDFLKKAKSEDYCFVENTDVLWFILFLQFNYTTKKTAWFLYLKNRNLDGFCRSFLYSR